MDPMELDPDLDLAGAADVVCALQSSRHDDSSPTVGSDDFHHASDSGHLSSCPPPLVATLEQPIVVVVLDTNVLLARLGQLDALHASAGQGVFQVLLYIPYVVITELDHLKDSDRSFTLSNGEIVSLASRARAATRWLQEHLLARSPHLMGQPTWHANLPLSFHRPRSNDDHILHACLLLHCGLTLPDLGIRADEAAWLLRVLLLTSDRALCVKALCHAISALAPTDLASSCPECHPIFAMLLPPQPLPPLHPTEEKEKSHSPTSPALQDNGYHSAVARATATAQEAMANPQGSEPTSPLATPDQQLCLCSKHPELHYAHDADATPVPVRRRLSHGSPVGGLMCTDPDA